MGGAKLAHCKGFTLAHHYEGFSPKNFNSSTKRFFALLRMTKAFTLAEVLITLAIIGVVAAMTMPVLFSKYRTQAIEARLQKFYSLMNQAVQMSEVEHGDKMHWATVTTQMIV